MPQDDGKRYSRRDFCRIMGAAGASLAAGPALRSAQAGSGSDDNRPNIILIMADDMGWSDAGCCGSEIRTPNLDSMARDGVTFTQFYNTGKCFPTRACLLTGVYAQQCGMARNHGDITNAITLGEALRPAGYRTLWAGKHHGDENPYFRGFDHYYGLRDGACNYFNPGYKREGEPKPAQKRYGKRYWCIDEKTYQPYTPEADDFYTCDYFTNYALDWLDEGQDDDRPFFLYMAYKTPHDPMQAWPEDIARYEGTYMDGYEETRRARYQRQIESGLLDPDVAPLSERQSPDWSSLSEEKQREEDRRMAVYAAMVDRMDQNIGRILDKLEELGEADNTLVLFLSDNGASKEVVKIGDGPIGSITRWASQKQYWANVSNTPLRRYKNSSLEGGICTPLIARWPAGIKDPGRITRWPGHCIDFMATFTDIAGADYPERFNDQDIVPMQGKSFLPILKDGSEPDREAIFWQWRRGRAIRRGDWKLVSDGGPWRLYNLAEDRTEQNDLSSKRPKMVKNMVKRWEKWYSDCYNGNPPGIFD